MKLQEILDWTAGRLANPGELSVPVDRISVERLANLARSASADVAFFFSREYEGELPSAKPGVLITAEPFVKPLQAAGLPLWKSSAVVVCPDPYHAMAVLSGKVADSQSRMAHANPARAKSSQIHPTAVVDAKAEIGPGCVIGPHCVVSEGAQVGAGTRLYASCFVGANVRVGEDCIFYPNVVLYELAEIGDRVRLHAGVVIGADGFGYAPKMQAGKPLHHEKIFHTGKVVIEDDVEIGANSCVDRGTFGETRIGRGSKIDNVCQIGHNATLAEGAIICGGTALAGRSSIGRFAMVGGHVGVINNVHVGDFAKVAAHTLVTKDVPPGGTVAGLPQRDSREHFKVHAMLNRLLEQRADRGKES